MPYSNTCLCGRLRLCTGTGTIPVQRKTTKERSYRYGTARCGKICAIRCTVLLHCTIFQCLFLPVPVVETTVPYDSMVLCRNYCMIQYSSSNLVSTVMPLMMMLAHDSRKTVVPQIIDIHRESSGLRTAAGMPIHRRHYGGGIGRCILSLSFSLIIVSWQGMLEDAPMTGKAKKKH